MVLAFMYNKKSEYMLSDNDTYMKMAQSTV